MKQNILILTLVFYSILSFSQAKVSVERNNNGMKLVVNGEDFMVNGMNWDYVPIGTNVLNGFWDKSDDYIKAALDSEMSLLKNMGVNTIRVYTGIKPKWITYIYKNYGIYTMLNHTFGAYGLTVNGVWYPNTEYGDEAVRKQLLDDAKTLANQYKNIAGLLLFMLGNENNYHLSWGGAETEDIPIESEGSTIRKRARAMYKLFNDAAKEMKSIDNNHPVAICNGDLLFLDIVKEECKDIDIYGTNMYRGISFGDAFQRVKDELDKPILFAEFGADAYNALQGKEDQYSQAYYMVENWEEIYKNAAGLGKVGNAIGGFTFQFSDGWWKYGWNERKNADKHDNNASWSNGGYQRDFAQGQNNMNEEWFGICAKGKTDVKGLYELYPRAAYYALKEAHALNPYTKDINFEFVDNYFKNIQLADAVLRARSDKAALGAESGNRLGISQLRAELTSFFTGGSLLTTPENPDPNTQLYPNRRGFDFMHSYFIGVEGKPTDNMSAEVNFNVIGKVAENPIDEIFYENLARPIPEVNTENGNVNLTDVNRLSVYNAKFEWNAKDFDIRGFYRTGHYHWGYEGDFFGLYREANYGPNLDIYRGETLGVEIDGKRAIKGLKVVAGPQVWWGANPTALFKYSRKIAGIDITGIYQRDLNTDLEFDQNGRRILDENQVRSGVIPAWPTERATLVLEKKFGNVEVALGGIWAGNPLNGSSFQDVRGTSGNYTVYTDKINSDDNWGGKAKITYQKGPINWYAQGAIMGLVANGGGDQTQTFTGWKLRDTGSGNQTNILSGFTYSLGNFQIAPNFLWQKPLVDVMPNDVGGPGRLRNILDDPFVVRANRETTAGEILFTYDPTPATWMYQWDNDRAEDAKFAMNLGFVYRHLPTTQDAHVGFLADRTIFAFPNSAPAQDLWEVHSRVVSKITPDFGLVANIYAGNGQGNGDSQRTIDRFGTDIKVIHKNLKVMGAVKVNDWGPFDYHRDFNLTFPLQLMLDVSTAIGKQDWFILPSTKIGLRGTWRSLDQFSPRYAPNAALPFANSPIISPVGFENGSEWEIRTYIHINIGK
ncbi:glycoside hydrolase family 2 TIM barrel-domain containing protein [Tenacibaculum agarivorans]|uniref:glycoside hydrolase family 2 TIM barrel-domain containing protein n=1 Tax=Tenacibaculum agarivorans TaxID=1908389 RepID=UPI00094B99CD|nr:glycoside hydrolase family 2 TIM barrel-domain containing protein [Tenacibaculum agarivorans]